MDPTAISEGAPESLRSRPQLENDVQAEEGEAVVVGDDGNAADRLAVQASHEETLRIGGGEALAILQSRIPSFACGLMRSTSGRCIDQIPIPCPTILANSVSIAPIFSK